MKQRFLSKQVSTQTRTMLNECVKVIDDNPIISHLKILRRYLISAKRLIASYCIDILYSLIDTTKYVNKTVRLVLTAQKFTKFSLKVKNTKMWIYFFVSVLSLTQADNSSTVFKALVIQANDPLISRIAMNSFQKHKLHH